MGPTGARQAGPLPEPGPHPAPLGPSSGAATPLPETSAGGRGPGGPPRGPANSAAPAGGAYEGPARPRDSATPPGP